MSGGLSMPHDKDTANNVMKFFIEKAYSRNLKPIFQEAVDILYKPDVFDVKEDNSGRMLFSCKLCNNDMNSHESLYGHSVSGKHQKNLDKKFQEEGIMIYKHSNRQTRSYPPGSLQHRLMNSTGKPIGLQMLEEYQNRGRSYFRCILCGAHGRLDAMYKHVVGTKHTERYIKASLELEHSILTAKERDTLSCHIADKYGINVDYIKIIRGNVYYPHKWEAEGKSAQQIKIDKVKLKQLHSPKRAKRRSPSRERRYSAEPERKRRHRTPSPTDSHYSRGRSSQSPQPSTSRSRYSESPPRHRHRERRDSSDSEISHRNRSPPSSRSGPHTPPPPMSPLPPLETRHVEVQKFDLDELMTQLNFLVKSQSMPDSDIKSEEDLDIAIRMMWNISLGLFYINKNKKESEDQPKHVRETLNGQTDLLRKILGFLKNYMGPNVGLDMHETGVREVRNRHPSY